MNEFGFTGRYLDKETNLWYFRARYHSGSLGRFINRDPLGYVDGMNLYAAWFIPSKTDPTGMVTKEDVQRAIERAREKGLGPAADLLQHWLSGSGSTYELDSGWLRKSPVTRAGEKKNENRFLEGTEGNRDNSLRDKAKKLCTSKQTFDDFDDYWEAALNFQGDNQYFYAVGSGTLKSTGSFNLTRQDVPRSVSADCCCVLITGRVKHEYIDKYNWDRGKATFFPGLGFVTDNDMKALEGPNPGDPKSFNIHSEWWRVFKGKFCNGAWRKKEWSDASAD